MVSIITVNYNDAKGLARTITSVVNQTFKDIEYIVVDGGSTDSSLEIIKQYAEKISTWISEKDKGVYHAMNKGISLAKGDYLLFLNSGDCFVSDDIISRVFSEFQVDKDIVFGNLLLESNGEIIREKTYPDKLTFKYFFYNESLPHPASFIKRSLFDKVGKYNEDFKIAADWEFWLKAIFLFQASYKRLPIPISIFNLEGISSKPGSATILSTEKNTVYDKYFPGIIDDYKEFDAFNINIRSNLFVRILRKASLLKV